MNRTGNFIRSEEGSILGLVLIWFLIMALLGTAFLTLAAFEGRHSARQEQRAAAFFLAEGGLNLALWRINRGPDLYGTFSADNVSVVYDSIANILSATGSSGPAICQLAVYNCYHQLRSGMDNDTVAIIYFGADRNTICFHHDDCCPSFSILPLGGNHITRSIEKHFHTSFLNAEEIKTGGVASALSEDHSSPSEIIRETALNQAADQIADTIRTMHLNLQIKNCDNHLGKIMLTGGSARLRQIDFRLADRLKIPAYCWNPFTEPVIEELVESDVAETWGGQAAPALRLALKAEA